MNKPELTYSNIANCTAMIFAVLPLVGRLTQASKVTLLSVIIPALLVGLFACWRIFLDIRKCKPRRRLPAALEWTLRLATLLILTAAIVLICIIPVYPAWLKCIVLFLLLDLWIRSQLWYIAPEQS